MQQRGIGNGHRNLNGAVAAQGVSTCVALSACNGIDPGGPDFQGGSFASIWILRKPGACALPGFPAHRGGHPIYAGV